MKWTEDGSGDAYAVHGGKIVTSRMINQLEDGAMIRLVNRLPGRGRKKKVAPRNKEGSDMSATDESSSSTLSSERLSLITEVNDVFGDGAVEQMKTIAYTGQGGWIEAWARKVVEMGEEKEDEILEYLCRAMRAEFGDVGAETMIGGLRKFVREQRRTEKDRRGKDEQEERRRHWKRDEETWEFTRQEAANKTVEDTRGDEATVVEEWGKGGKGVGMSGGWFWQTGQQQWHREEVELEAAQQWRREKPEQEATRQRQQEEVVQEAARQRQREEAEQEAVRRQQRQQEEAAQQQRQQQEEAVQRQQVEQDEAAKREDQRRRSEEEETAREVERRQRRERVEEDPKRRERQEKAAVEERQKIQPARTVCFGRYYGKTCEWVYNQDRQYCEWISRQESSNRALLEFQEFVRAAERREKRKELEMREKTFEENRRKKEL